MEGKVYSRVDLLGEYYRNNTKGGGVFGRLVDSLNKRRFQQYSFHVPRGMYLRMEHFCDFVEEAAEAPFTQDKLINALFHEFLMVAFKTLDINMTFKQLMMMKQGAGKGMQLVKQDPDSFTFRVLPGGHKQKMEKVYVSFRRSYAIKLEILLEDMDQVVPDHGFIFEDVLAYMYCDFVNAYNKGNRAQLVKRIIKSLGPQEDEDEDD